MKLKAALKYQIYGMKKPLIIYYIIVYAFMILFVAQRLFWKDSNIQFSGSGHEMASVIFLFVCGLNSFKSTFYMFLANGVSRRTLFKSFAAMAAPVAALMALIDSLNNLLMSSFNSYTSMFSNMYSLRYGGIEHVGANAQVFAEGFLWMFALYMAVTMLGFFITTIYYRMSKPLKLLVSIGVPVFLFIVLPYADAAIFSGAIFRGIGYFFKLANGLLDGPNPYIAVLSYLLAFAALGGLSFLAMRRATVKGT